MNTSTESRKDTEKFTTISLNSSSKSTIRVLLNIVIIIILVVIIIYAVVGTYIFYHKYVRDGAAPVVEAATTAVATATESAAATEAVAKLTELMGGFYLKHR
jgi:flagellar basal body-associated protein FliL